MQHLLSAFWHGITSGAAARTRELAPSPQAGGFTSSLAQALYWLGFELANVIVHGPRG